MKWLFFFTFSLICTTSSTINFDTAEKKAHEKSIPLLLVFSGSDWCRPCILFEKDVLAQSQFLTFTQDSLVVFKADFPRNIARLTQDEISENQQLAQKYNPKGAFPYLVLFTAEGKIAKEKSGAFQTVDELKAWVRD